VPPCSPLVSSVSVHYAPSMNGDFCTAAGGFEFALGHHSVGSAGIATTMNSTEELFLLRPHPRRVTTRAVDDRSPRPRRARSAIQHRFPRVPGSPRTQSLPTSLGLLSSSSAHHMIGPTSAPVHPRISNSGFFYKYNPLSNDIVKSNPL
jgi:hypothetical protein